MNEVEFIDSIDCQFSYDTEEKWRTLITQAVNISPNAAFMILHEICRPPRRVDHNVLEAILRQWRQQFSHPLVEVVLPAAESMMSGKELPVAECMDIMRVVAAYKHQYNALSIPYFACNDTNGEAENLRQKIISEWRKS